MASLAEIRARLQAQDKSAANAQGNGDSPIYPHWNAPDNTTSIVRFLPDADTNNPFFWVERQIINLKFNGIKDVSTKETVVQVPCVEMWGDKCPVLDEVRPWFNDPSLEDMARSYWKKRSYFFQGFVRESAVGDDKTPENPIRRFIISPMIYKVIKQSLMDPDLEELPTHYTHGLDFKLTKTKDGQWSDYSTSSWARKETSLTESELQAIETHGLANLADFLPKRPGAAELEIIKQLFEDSVEGKPYDPAKYGMFYKPRGFEMDAATESAAKAAKADTPAQQAAPAQQPAPAQQAAADSIPWEDDVKVAESAVVTPQPEAEPVDSQQRANDILAMIRSRQQS